MINIPNIGEILSKQNAIQKKANKNALFGIRHLVHQNSL